MPSPSRSARPPIVPDRVRAIGREGFAFLPNRFLRDGFFASLSRDELTLYLLLVLAGDRQGVSFYGYDALCSLLGTHLDRFLVARNALIDLDLVAFDGTRFQVLALPDRPRLRPAPPLRSQADFEDRDPATIHFLVRTDLGLDDDGE